MSAIFVAKHDIDLLVSAIRELKSHVRLQGRHDRADRIDPDDLGKMLWSENVKSLRCRYPTDRDEHRAFDREVLAYAFTEYPGVKPGPIGSLADFYDYQTCEHPAWRDSDAFFAMCELRVELVKRLPGAASAPWGVTDATDIAGFAAPTLDSTAIPGDCAMTAPSWVSPGSRLFLVAYEGADGKPYALALSNLDVAHRISRLQGGEVIDTAVDRHADFALDA